MKVVIVGAGLAGLTAALALRATGADVAVYDRARNLASIQLGIGMVIWPNAMRALAELGLAGAVADAGHRIDRLEFFASAGRRLTHWPVEDVGRRVGQPSIAISRPTLHAVLSEAYGGENITFSSKFVDLEETGDQVIAHFEDGSEARGDILIGADGVASAVRRKLTSKGPPEFPPYAGYTIWHAIIPYREAGVVPNVFTLLFGRGHRFAHYRIDDERSYWSGIGFVPEGGQKIIRKADALAMFGGYRAPVPALIEQTPESSIQRHDIYGGESLGALWGTGRATVMGDAAHPMTTNLGQGAGMAIEDGVVLAQCLARAATPVEGLRAYEQRRIPRTDTMMELANRLNSSAALESRVRTALRNLMLARGFDRAIRPRYEAFIEAEALA